MADFPFVKADPDEEFEPRPETDLKLVKIEKRINGRSWWPGEFVGLDFNSKKFPHMEKLSKHAPATPKKFDGDRVVEMGGGRVASASEAFERLCKPEFIRHGYQEKEYDTLLAEANKAAAKGDRFAKYLVELHAEFDAGLRERAEVEKGRKMMDHALALRASSMSSLVMGPSLTDPAKK